MTSKQRASDGRAVNDKGVPFAEVLASLRRGESLDPVDVINAQSWRIDNQSREIASLRKQLLAARSPVETTRDDALYCEQDDTHGPMQAAVCLGCWNRLAQEVIELRKQVRPAERS